MILKIEGQEATLKNLSSELANLNGITNSVINNYFQQCGFNDISNVNSYNNGRYTLGNSKRDRIFKNFANEINHESDDKIIRFIELIFTPSNYINKIEVFESDRMTINSLLLFLGCEIDKNGKIKATQRVNSLDEVDKRVNNLKNKLRERNVHLNVLKYCSREYLSKDYFHACFEAVKGLYSRLRDISGLTCDGEALINKIFSKNEPMLLFNDWKDESDKSEFDGIKYLFLTLHKMIRNPDAHTTRISKETSLEDCLDYFSMISKAHRLLDKATITCFKK